MSKQLKPGAKVTGPDGAKYVVLVHNEGSPAVQVETVDGVSPYRRTWIAADALKTSRGSKPSDDDQGNPPNDPPAGDKDPA